MISSLQNKRKKFKLSQEQIAQALNLTRQTFAKIENGERVLTPEEKEKLETFFKSFELEEKTEQIRFNTPEENIKKFKQVFLYILEKVGAKPNVGMTVLYKLLYFIDFDYYEKYEKQLMGLTYFKNTHGPAPRNFAKFIKEMTEQGELVEVNSKYFTHEQKKFLPRKEPDLSLLNGRELEMIDDVLRRYSDKSAIQLSEMSHRDMPWKAAKSGENLEYEHAFYRSEEFSVREYDPL
jgi:transcriptional regulator with XRE-family HTH domain